MKPEEEEEEGMLQTGGSAGSDKDLPDLAARIQSMRAGGRPLPGSERTYYETRFGHDFGSVRIHTDSHANETAKLVNARAFTLGRDVVFRAGAYSPSTEGGRRLLAHELTHVVQQNKVSARYMSGGTGRPENRQLNVKQSLPCGTLAGEWQIRNRGGQNPFRPRGRTDEQILEQGFRDICPLARRSGSTIRIPTNVTSTTNTAGCRCLQDIERGLPALKTSRPPATVAAVPHGWSSTCSSCDPVTVSARHPDDPFQWGYWTTTTAQRPTERRHVKPFWQTLAHEICGHVATYVRTGGTHSGGRAGNPRHHDPAIEAENLVASEHNVPVHEQRGYEFAHGGRPATRHAGESFLAATIPDFAHRSDTLLPYAITTRVLDSAVNTSRRFPVFVELEGSAYANEGGRALALRRAEAVKKELIRRGVLPTFTTRAGVANTRRYTIRAIVASGRSIPNTCQTGKVVYVYLYHNPRSAGP